jgi:hypothetical protein
MQTKQMTIKYWPPIGCQPENFPSVRLASFICFLQQNKGGHDQADFCAGGAEPVSYFQPW